MQTANNYLDVGVIGFVTANPDKVLLWLVLFSTFPFPKHDDLEDLLAVWIDNEAKHFYWQNLEPYKWATESISTVQCSAWWLEHSIYVSVHSNGSYKS